MKLISAILVIILFGSCVNTKKTGAVWVKANQDFFERRNGLGPIRNPTDSVRSVHLKNGIKARITLPKTLIDQLTIKFVQNPIGRISKSDQRIADGDPKVDGYYFPGKINIPEGKAVDEDFRGKKFKYIEIKQALQTLTIPLKLRPGIRDTIKSTASAGVNIGFAYVFKFTSHTHRRLYWNDNGKANVFAEQNNKFTYAFGPFIGPTIIDLKSGNTDFKVVKDRSVVGLTYGGVAVLGYNEFNVGIALGFDNAIGGEAKNWIYNRRPWFGIVVALDIIK